VPTDAGGRGGSDWDIGVDRYHEGVGGVTSDIALTLPIPDLIVILSPKMTSPTKDSFARDLYYEALRRHYDGDYETAYDIFRELHSRHSELFDPGILELRIGSCCFKLAEKDISRAREAVKYLRQSYALLDRKQHRFELMGTFDVLGMTLWLLGQTEETLLYMEEGLQYLDEYEPRNPNPEINEELLFGRAVYLMLLGDCYFYDARYDEALASYDSGAVEIRRMSHPERLTSDLLFRIGRVHHYSGNDNLAVENLSQVVLSDLSPDSIRYYRFTLLRLHLGKKEYEEAIEQFNLLEEVGIPPSNDAYAYHFAGIAHYVLTRNPEAKLLFEKALQYPGPDWIAERSTEYLKRIAAAEKQLN
jgi:tetratricopeptide (TPR) repeat protein